MSGKRTKLNYNNIWNGIFINKAIGKKIFCHTFLLKIEYPRLGMVDMFDHSTPETERQVDLCEF